MQKNIKLKLDVSKIRKGDLYEGKKGIYLDAVLLHNRDGQSQYGDDGFIVQNISQEAREAGERGPIIGNWRWQEPKSEAATSNNDNDEKVPF